MWFNSKIFDIKRKSINAEDDGDEEGEGAARDDGKRNNKHTESFINFFHL